MAKPPAQKLRRVHRGLAAGTPPSAGVASRARRENVRDVFRSNLPYNTVRGRGTPYPTRPGADP